MTRRGIPSYRCRLLEEPEGRSHDIPQWMFDASVCALMRESDQAQVSLDALRALGALIVELHGDHDAAVVENAHFQLNPGDASHETQESVSAKEIPN